MPPFAHPVSPPMRHENEKAPAKGRFSIKNAGGSAERRAREVTELAAALGRSKARDLSSALGMLADAELIIAAQRQRIAFLESLAMTDELTGLLNRRGFHQALEREIAACERDPAASGMLLLLDLDHFKRVNDTYGHPAGDALLRLMAETLQAALRPTDVVARLGGDEFAVLITRLHPSIHGLRADGLRQMLTRAVLMWERKKIPLCASVGAVSYGPLDAPDALVLAADEQLYRAKRGR